MCAGPVAGREVSGAQLPCPCPSRVPALSSTWSTPASCGLSGLEVPRNLDALGNKGGLHGRQVRARPPPSELTSECGISLRFANVRALKRSVCPISSPALSTARNSSDATWQLQTKATGNGVFQNRCPGRLPVYVCCACPRGPGSADL